VTPADANWLAVRVQPSQDRRDAIIAALFEAGSGGLLEEGDVLVTQFAPGTDEAALRSALLEADPSATVATTYIKPADWTREWRGTVRKHRAGPLTISPPWLADGLDPATTVIIDPAMAFGTGEHATTRGVTRLLARHLRAGDRVADLGAGSAVLAIAAVKLGASYAAAIEIDNDAIANAEENAARNEVSEKVIVIEGDAKVFLPLVAPVRLILANIISSVLLQLLDAMRDALTADGIAILGGILSDEQPRMRIALESSGWKILEEDEEAGWWSVAIARR
jgi:ribosomal protein L11 methyltransferase